MSTTHNNVIVAALERVHVWTLNNTLSTRTSRPRARARTHTHTHTHIHTHCLAHCEPISHCWAIPLALNTCRRALYLGPLLGNSVGSATQQSKGSVPVLFRLAPALFNKPIFSLCQTEEAPTHLHNTNHVLLLCRRVTTPAPQRSSLKIGSGIDERLTPQDRFTDTNDICRRVTTPAPQERATCAPRA